MTSGSTLGRRDALHAAAPKRRLAGAPPRQARWPRRLFKATTPDEPERLPSDRPEPCGSSELRSGLLFGLAPISLDTLSRAAIRADPVKGWLVASRYSRSRLTRLAARPTTSRKDASLRLLQPTSRYEHPYGSFDSRSCLPRALASPLRDTSRLRLWRRLDPGGASLDGDPPASAVVMTLRGLANGAVEASCLAWRWRRPVLAGAAIDSPSERRRPAAVFSTVCRARDSTSDAPCRARLLPSKTARYPPGARPAFAGASSKPPASSDQSAFHRRMLSCESPPPFSRLRRREAASEARSPLVRRPVSRALPRG